VKKMLNIADGYIDKLEEVSPSLAKKYVLFYLKTKEIDE